MTNPADIRESLPLNHRQIPLLPVPECPTDSSFFSSSSAVTQIYLKKSTEVRELFLQSENAPKVLQLRSVLSSDLCQTCWCCLLGFWFSLFLCCWDVSSGSLRRRLLCFWAIFSSSFNWICFL